MDKGKKFDASHNGKLRIEWQNNRILVSDGTTNLLHIGERSDGSIGYDLAPTGVEVTTASIGELVASDRLKTFTIAVDDTIRVTRTGGTGSAYQDVLTGSLGAPMFLCTVSNPFGSPSFRFQTPNIVFDSGGHYSAQRRALYDPTTGVIRFFVEANSLYPSYGTSETWEFQYFLMYQNIP